MMYKNKSSFGFFLS